ncbi:PQQ-dependent sugar dehydrogenase [Salinisphaera aquimarina]|uniref:PQQ-dependent sugar dehydrogenase n=1 Tax=Salinisphaera aquimarina TaxID=2094031 RepID=A0ABV7ES05_9GAMM
MFRSPLIGLSLLLPVVLLSACGSEARLQVADGIGPEPQLPDPESSLIPTVNIAKAEPWQDGQAPTAADGLNVTAFARGLDHPRWLYVLPNGDVLVAETNGPTRPEDATGIRGWVMKKVMARAGAGVESANRITLLRDTDDDGVADERHVFLDNLNSPFGMALVDGTFYVANTDGIVEYDYRQGADTISAAGRSLVSLPAGPINHHWTKNIIASPDGRTLYATVGSNSNVAENGFAAEQGRAAIWAVDRESGQHRLYASGLRNPNGMTFVPGADSGKQLWTVVNERDEIGSDLVPDYMTSVQDGGFYGWPYSYYGQHVDERVQPQKPELVATAIKPDYALGPHTASLGLTYSDNNTLGERFGNGMFVGQHGSWNRKPHSGYRVIYVPFENGQPDGKPVVVLDDFLSEDETAQGRPVGVAIDNGGDLLVADDVGNTIWRVSGPGAGR